MPLATDPMGLLQPIKDIFITIPGAPGSPFHPRILPEITDSKSATYADEPVQGRSFPIKTYAHSENRVITMKWHFVILDAQFTLNEALQAMRAFKSAVYPTDSASSPYAPPPICSIQFGNVLSKNPLCVILRHYTISYPTDVALDVGTLLPYRFDVDLSWEEVRTSTNLPNQSMIIND